MDSTIASAAGTGQRLEPRVQSMQRPSPTQQQYQRGRNHPRDQTGKITNCPFTHQSVHEQCPNNKGQNRQAVKEQCAGKQLRTRHTDAQLLTHLKIMLDLQRNDRLAPTEQTCEHAGAAAVAAQASRTSPERIKRHPQLTGRSIDHRRDLPDHLVHGLGLPPTPCCACTGAMVMEKESVSPVVFS